MVTGELDYCSQSTSNRDPRVTVYIQVPSGTGHGRIGTWHTFWNKWEADQFIEMVSDLDASGKYRIDCHDIFRANFIDASATKLTTPEICWLCVPLDATPEDWMIRPDYA